MREDINKRTDDLNEDLKVRQESINLLKGRLTSQITSFKETISKVLNKDTSLAERFKPCLENKELRLLPYSQLLGWPLGYLLKHSYLVGVSAASEGGNPPPKDEASLKEWIRNKLKALASLLG